MDSGETEILKILFALSYILFVEAYKSSYSCVRYPNFNENKWNYLLLLRSMVVPLLNLDRVAIILLFSCPFLQTVVNILVALG